MDKNKEICPFYLVKFSKNVNLEIDQIKHLTVIIPIKNEFRRDILCV